jgi:arylsulfatase A-like enzyme
MDMDVGRILQRLSDLGLRDDTLIIFASDNGYSCGHHGFWGKGNGTFPLNMYENSIRVPLIISHPGQLAGGRSVEALVSGYDFMPTLLAYLRLPLPTESNLPGQSLLPLLEGHDETGRESVVVYDEYGPVRMIRTMDWKYVHRYPYGPNGLYDLVSDPDERLNLIDEPAYRGRASDLRQRLVAWFAQYVDVSMDGARFPVTGQGQSRQIGPRSPGENGFHPLTWE